MYTTFLSFYLVARRGLSTKQAGASYAGFRPLLVGGAAVAGAVGVYAYQKRDSLSAVLPIPVAQAASTPAYQASVSSKHPHVYM